MTATEVDQRPDSRPSTNESRHTEVEASRRFARKLLAPSLVALILITQIPFLVTIYYSLQQWNLSRPDIRGFAGLSNYVAVFTNGYFLPSVWATIKIVGGSVIVSLLLGLVMALLLNREFFGRPVARTLMITPFLVMPAAASLVFKWSLFNSEGGIVNWFIGLFGIPPVAWNTDHPVFSVMIVMIWQYTPFFMLLLLAGLQSQDREVLEAADVDGAGAFRKFFFMTLPHLRTYAELAVLLGTILMLQLFDPVNIITKGAGGTKTLPYLLYERAFIGQQVGEAAAYGVVTVVLIIVIATFALRKVFRVFTEEEGR
ncbi:carbohydrate ABC transporter permease [Naumannella halotolerans]|uniref:Sorbitol/mannitol transport system permease protein n=1 Tax=Naumannella halotolerans TaxID=993414 RepID=A0A4R7J9Q0_9ACTN|nr:sugar ABC transporter permease [Naumannella halotolerans]TDT34272.1 sorbitol/mannitol transport system permease protein [Naumannella halotolerans]